MKSPLNWKKVGQFVAILVRVFSLIQDTYDKMKVGLEILPWLIGDGKEVFVMKFLEPLGREFLTTQRIRVIDENTIEVNLDAPPTLPFDGARVEHHVGGGWVKVQKRPDGLYVDGRKVELYLSERQQGVRLVRGHELREEVSKKLILNSNVLDALAEYPDLVPEDWKRDAAGDILYIFFWATIFRDIRFEQSLSVRFFYFGILGWQKGYFQVRDNWRYRNPAAVCSQVSSET